jgi:predicted amino acid racemase
MFVDALLRRNPKLIDAALELHARGDIPPATFVIDLEVVERNARLLAEEAKARGIDLYFMSKQIGRNPIVAERIAATIPAAVAVELDEALTLARAGVRVGHIGHLVQIPARFMEASLALEPEVMTVFSYEKAVQVAAATKATGREQDLLLRVRGPGDFFYPGQEGGVALADLPEAWDRIGELDGVNAVGLTSYPVFAYVDGRFIAMPNLATLEAAAESVGGVEQFNAPGHTSVAVLALLARSPATHAEPGHALTGTTPLAADEDTPELPACCVISEVSHMDHDHVWVFGGAFYNRGNCRTGLLRHGSQTGRLEVCDFPADAIDYYRPLVRAGAEASVGDPVVFAYRFQAFTSRAKVAAVDGVGKGQPVVVGLNDGLGNPVGVGR